MGESEDERDGSTTDDQPASGDLPVEVVTAAERLTRLARDAVDEAEARAYRDDRDARLAEFGFRARVREEDARDVLVLHPDEWLEDGTVRFDRIEDRSRAVEVPLGGVGEADDWETVEAHNREVVERVAAEGGPVHAANARAFADFMGNHYLRRVESAGAPEVEEFLAEYFPRNAWPTDAQRDAVAESLRLVFDVAGREPPAPVQ